MLAAPRVWNIHLPRSARTLKLFMERSKSLLLSICHHRGYDDDKLETFVIKLENMSRARVIRLQIVDPDFFNLLNQALKITSLPLLNHLELDSFHPLRIPDAICLFGLPQLHHLKLSNCDMAWPAPGPMNSLKMFSWSRSTDLWHGGEYTREATVIEFLEALKHSPSLESLKLCNAFGVSSPLNSNYEALPNIQPVILSELRHIRMSDDTFNEYAAILSHLVLSMDVRISLYISQPAGGSGDTPSMLNVVRHIGQLVQACPESAVIQWDAKILVDIRITGFTSNSHRGPRIDTSQHDASLTTSQHVVVRCLCSIFTGVLVLEDLSDWTVEHRSQVLTSAPCIRRIHLAYCPPVTIYTFFEAPSALHIGGTNKITDAHDAPRLEYLKIDSVDFSDLILHGQEGQTPLITAVIEILQGTQRLLIGLFDTTLCYEILIEDVEIIPPFVEKLLHIEDYRIDPLEVGDAY